ncbi:glucosaminidase domain-containing protein [Mammaliicoccus lentus]|uniref:glucosaminidase domain-containing protein n=1 Tax=Mammaliicoccus lentus TaxID=42858 RepID=UPI002DB70F71|nr:glucosaminidase domain-containing protein [Mammaliicoccus lentus]MEB5685888.1 glucosaminidase domain-containing protein [Mammaliicoccus lentus]
MDKKFYYKTPAIVAMTLAGTTLVTHQVNAEETKSNKDSNIIEQHDNANQIQKEKQELQNQSLNISGSKEYKDPSIIDDVETTEQQTSNETTEENNYSNVANNPIENSSNQEKAQDDATSDNVSAEDNASAVEQDSDVNANDQEQVKDNNASDDATSDNVSAEDNASDVEQDSDVNANDQEQVKDNNASDDATSDNVSAEDNTSDVEQDSDEKPNDQEQAEDNNTSDDTTSDNLNTEDNTSDVEQDTSEKANDQEKVEDDNTSDNATSDDVNAEDNTSDVEQDSDEKPNNQEQAEDNNDSDDATSDNVSAEDNASDVEQDSDVNANDQEQVKDNNTSDDTTSNNVNAEDNASDVEQDSDVNANNQEQAKDDNTSDDTTSDNVSAEDNASDVEQDSDEKANDQEQAKDDNTSDDTTSDNVNTEDNTSDVEQDSDEKANNQEQAEDNNDSDDATSDNVSAEDNASDVEQDSDEKANNQEQAKDDNTSDDTTSDNVNAEDNTSDVEQDNNENIKEQSKEDNTSNDAESDENNQTNQANETNISEPKVAYKNAEIQSRSAAPQSNSTKFRTAVNAPSAPKVRAANVQYEAAVNSSINNQIRNNNYTVPKYVEDFSSHIPKIPYRNGVGKPEGIVAHETANPNSTIHNEIAYMKNNYESAFVHAYVDDNNIIEVAPTDYLAWGAGAQANPRFIHVELVRVYGSDRFARSINNYADYIATNLAYYGLSLDSAERDGVGTLWSHDAVSKFLGGTDHSDPYGWFAENNYTFDELVDLVTEKYQYKTGLLTAPTKPETTKPVTKPTTKPSQNTTKPSNPTVSKPSTKPTVSKPNTKPSKPTVSKPNTKPSKPVVSKPSTKPEAKPSKPVVSKPANTIVVDYVGKVNTNASGVYTSVYDNQQKSAANKAGKTFKIGKQSTYNNQVFYLLQDNNSTPLGWVKASDVQLQSSVKPKPTQKPNNTVVKPKPVESTSKEQTSNVKPVSKSDVSSVVNPKPVAQNNTAVKPKPTVSTNKVQTNNAKPVTQPAASTAVKSKPAAQTNNKVAKPSQVAQANKNYTANTERVNYVGTVNKNISGVYTSVYNDKTVPAVNKAGKTFKIGKQSVINNQTFYLLQDNNAIPLGWVKSQDVQLQNATKPKTVTQPTVTPKKTEAIKASTVNNTPIAYQENYTNYLITDNTGYFYSEPYASKNTLLGSLQNYHYAYFKVITSQQIGNELWYKGILNGQTVWINAKYLQIAETSTKSSTSPYTLDEAVDIQMALKNGTEPKKVLPSGVRKVTRAEVKDAMDTSKYIDDPVQKYQFLDLNQSQNIPVSKLNELLRGKGILENQGEAFSEAAKSVGVNEIYLISHALLETGNGTSDLAKGGSINSDGKVDLKSDTKYYNMFGVGAIDDNALYGGIKYAQQAGWDTPSKAIFGGAQFISSNYINAGQNTLYKMRFNPQNPGEHQYATGVDFSTSNAKRISDFYQQIQTDGEYYDFDRYKS